jgi:hypothetical protein
MVTPPPYISIGPAMLHELLSVQDVLFVAWSLPRVTPLTVLAIPMFAVEIQANPAVDFGVNERVPEVLNCDGVPAVALLLYPAQVSVLAKKFALVDKTSDAGQLATAHAPKVDVEDAKFVEVVPPMTTPPAVVDVAFEFKRIWPLAESRLVLFRVMSPKPPVVSPAV